MAWAICVGTVHILSSYFVKWNKSTSETTHLYWVIEHRGHPPERSKFTLMLLGNSWWALVTFVYTCLFDFSTFYLFSFNLVTKSNGHCKHIGMAVLLFPQLLKLKFLWWEIWNGHLYLHVYGDTLATRDIVVYFRI